MPSKQSLLSARAKGPFRERNSPDLGESPRLLAQLDPNDPAEVYLLHRPLGCLAEGLVDHDAQHFTLSVGRDVDRPVVRRDSKPSNLLLSALSNE